MDNNLKEILVYVYIGYKSLGSLGRLINNDNNLPRNVQFDNRVRSGDNRLWVSYREQLIGPFNARFDYSGKGQSRGQQPVYVYIGFSNFGVRQRLRAEVNF